MTNYMFNFYLLITWHCFSLCPSYCILTLSCKMSISIFCNIFYWIFSLFTFQMLSPFPVSPLEPPDPRFPPPASKGVGRPPPPRAAGEETLEGGSEERRKWKKEGRDLLLQTSSSLGLDRLDLGMVAFKDLSHYTAVSGGEGQTRGGNSCWLPQWAWDLAIFPEPQ